ncbi:MAG: AraC family transcriptional regulator [Chloroflexus sp.]
MDAFTAILDILRLKSSVYCRSELGSPWGLHFAACPNAVFHVLHRGRGYLRLVGEEELRLLSEGDVLLLPDGEEHILQETPTAPLLYNLTLDQWGECALMRWSDQPTTVLLCGTFTVEHQERWPLLRQLPRLIHIPRSAADALASVLALMAAEAEASRPGKEAVLRRLADILFIQMIQRWVEMQGIEQCGLPGAIFDPLIGKALNLIHNQPHHPWTVATLARAIACSRSAFAARFTTLVGEPPIAYLHRWRVQLAMRLLVSQPRMRIGEVAAQVGYHSEAAFTRAFKRQVGVSPRTYRLAVQNELAASVI